MSVSTAEVGRPLPFATSTIARASSSACSRSGRKAPSHLHVHHERVEPRGELLREDRGHDQRDRLDGAGGVADRVQPAVRGCEPRRLHYRRAGSGHRAAEASGSGACRIPGSPRACRACRRCGRGRGPRSSAPRRRTRPRSAPAGGSPCRPRRRSSACRAPARAGRRRTSRHVAGVAHRAGQRDALGRGHAAQHDRHRERAHLGVATLPSAMPCTSSRAGVAQLTAVTLDPIESGTYSWPPLDEAHQQRREVLGGALGVAAGLLVASCTSLIPSRGC